MEFKVPKKSSYKWKDENRLKTFADNNKKVKRRLAIYTTQ